MSIKTKLHNALVNAMRESKIHHNEQATIELAAVRAALAAIQVEEKAPKAKLVDGELSDEAVANVIYNQIKQRNESAKIYATVDPKREVQERAEAAILAEFAPKRLTEDETRELVERIVKDNELASGGGKAIGAIMKNLPSNVDKGTASKIAREFV